MPSHLSVNISPENRLRHWCSFQYLRISPLHWKFHFPLLNSRTKVLKAIPRLSPGISLLTFCSAYMRFTPSNSEHARTFRITAAAGTELAGPSSSATVIILTDERVLQP